MTERERSVTEIMRKNPKWYHWMLLALCAIGMLTMGILNVTGGAAPSSRFYLVDDVVVRLLGTGLIVFSLSLFLRRNWAFVGAICCLGLSILEILVTYNFGASSPLLTVIKLLVTLACIAVFFGIPLILLAWLRAVLIKRMTEPTSPPYSESEPSASSENGT